MRRPERTITRALFGLAAVAYCAGCGGEQATGSGTTTPADTNIGFAGADSIVAEDVGNGAGNDDATPTDGAQAAIDVAGSPVASVEVTVADTLELGTTITVVLKATKLDGKAADLGSAAFEADGKAIAVGANLNKDSVTTPIAVWKHADDGTWRIAGARPGKATLVVRVGGVASKGHTIDVTWPAKPIVRFSQGGVTASVDAQRQLDDANTIRLGGKAVGKGGGSIALRFPVVAKAGDVLDVEKTPAKGGLSVTGSFADLGGAKFTLAKGFVAIDQTGNGQLRGTFSGLAASLKPVAGVFVVDRQGKFGIDIVDDKPIAIAASDAPTPQTGSHHSRVSVGGVGDQAVVLHRHIAGKFKADLERNVLGHGAVKAALKAPVMDDATAYTGLKDGQPGPFNAAIGYAAVQPMGAGYLVVWEGRAKKGHSQPHGLWARAFDDKHMPVSDTASVSTDPCHGQCEPVAAATVGGAVIAWNTSGGAVASRGINALIKAGKLSFMQGKSVEVVPTGKGVQIASLAGKTLATWHDGSKVRWSMGAGAGGWGVKNGIDGTDKMTHPGAVAAVAQGGGGFFVLFTCSKSILRVDKVSLSAATIGKPAEVGSCSGDRFLAAAGANGQVVWVERQPGNATYIIRARKLRWASEGADAEVLGKDLEIAKVVTGSFVRTALARIPTSNTFIVGWAGDLDSAGVFVRRFR